MNTKIASKNKTLTALEWAVKNNLRKVGKYWRIDYSIIAYTDETIVKAFEDERYPFVNR